MGEGAYLANLTASVKSLNLCRDEGGLLLSCFWAGSKAEHHGDGACSRSFSSQDSQEAEVGCVTAPRQPQARLLFQEVSRISLYHPSWRSDFH